jgi:hypothetical protein
MCHQHEQQIFHLLSTECNYVLCLVLRTYNHFIVRQLQENGFYNGDGMNLLRGTSSIFVNNSSNLSIFKGLMTYSVTQIEESHLITYILAMTWKGVIVLNLVYYPRICLVTLMKAKINN